MILTVNMILTLYYKGPVLFLGEPYITASSLWKRDETTITPRRLAHGPSTVQQNLLKARRE